VCRRHYKFTSPTFNTHINDNNFPASLRQKIGEHWILLLLHVSVVWLTLPFVSFKVCKSVHHRSIQINLPSRCNNFSSLLLTFIYSSTGFGRLHANHKELNNCSSNLWFYRWSVVIAVLLVVVGPAGVNARVIYTKYHCYQPGTFLGITPVSSVSNGLHFLNIPLVSVMRVIYTSKGTSKKFGVLVIYRKIR
jgi:hypothetical protein